MNPNEQDGKVDMRQRADEKQASRLADELALRSGQKSVDDLRRENGHFGMRAKLKLHKAVTLT
jgi:hypothetical protein